MDRSKWTFRCADHLLLSDPKAHFKSQVYASELWNEVPLPIKQSNSLNIFFKYFEETFNFAVAFTALATF